MYERSRAERRRAGDTLGEAVQAMNIAEVFSDQGRFSEAMDLLHQAGGVFDSASYPVGMGIVQSDLGRVMGRSGEPAEGLGLLDQAVAMLEAIGSTGHVLDAKLRRAECLLWLGAYDEADQVIAELTERVERHEGNADLAVAVSRCRAWSLVRRGQPQAAVPVIDSAISGCRAAGPGVRARPSPPGSRRRRRRQFRFGTIGPVAIRSLAQCARNRHASAHTAAPLIHRQPEDTQR